MPWFTRAVAAIDVVSLPLLHNDLRSALATLSEQEASVIQLRCRLTDGQPHTLDQLGHFYGVTRERIRQIEIKTMTKLRQPSRCQALRGYLD